MSRVLSKISKKKKNCWKKKNGKKAKQVQAYQEMAVMAQVDGKKI